MNLVAVFYMRNKLRVGIMSTRRSVVAAAIDTAEENIHWVLNMPCLFIAVGWRFINA